MKPNDPEVTWSEDKPLGLAERLVSAALRPGALDHGPALVSPKVTVSYPGAAADGGQPAHLSAASTG